jgi:hypothetical protein
MCECGKGFVMPKYLTELTVDTWGPTFWKLLHLQATRLGSSDSMKDDDSANNLTYLVNNLHSVLPCKECASHARAYVFEHKFKPRGLYGDALRNYVETYLLNFHNAVRSRKGQPILLTTIAEYHALWVTAKIIPCDEEDLKLYFDYGKTYGILDYTSLTRWLNVFKRQRLLLNF